MTRPRLVVMLLVVWVALCMASILVPAQMAPTGEGFTRGFNRLSVFYQYQLAAGLVAVAIWWLGRGLAARWVTWIPLGVALVVALLTAGVILAV